MQKRLFKNSFITYAVRQWNKLSTEIHSSTSYQQFRKSLLSFINPNCSTLFFIQHRVGVKLSVRLRLGFSNLREHKFRLSFNDTLNPLSFCSLKPETTSHYLLRWRNFSSARSALMNDFNLIEPSISQLNEPLNQIYFYKVIQRKEHHKIATFCKVLSNISKKRFDESLFLF